MSRSLDMLTAEIVALKARVGALEAVELSVTGILCRVYNSANISIPNATTTALTFDSERIDAAGMHSTSSNTGRITIATPGSYLVGAHIRFASAAGGSRRQLAIRDQGGTGWGILELPSNAAGNLPMLSVATFVPDRVAGNWFDVAVYQDSGAALNVLATPSYSPEFWAVRIA